MATGWKKATEAPMSESDDKFERLLAVLAEKQTNAVDLDALKAILGETQQATAKALRPENEAHPGKSVFSHVEGDQKHPKPSFGFDLFWNNYPVHKFPETETWKDWELYAQLTPGKYTILRKDGSRMTVTITGEHDADGKVTKLTVTFPILASEKWQVPPTYVTLYQLVHNDRPAREVFVEAMQLYFQDMLPVAV